ncbi:MAG: tetratricopeptide repeat protein [Elusimicrobia bacterium]|nr:tetratricopeptide repeat protein [Elusimicrobiota bacterium]
MVSFELIFDRAEALRAQGYLSGAARLYRRLLRGPAGQDVRLDAALALVACLRSLGQTDDARQVWSRARRLAPRRGAPEALRRLDLEGLLVERAAGGYRRCLPGLARHLARFRRERDWAGAAYALWAIGGARRFMGDLEASRLAFLRSLGLARRARDAAGAAYALFGLGGVTRVQGRLAEAREYYSAALAAVAGTDDIFGRAYAQCGLANVLRQQGELASARRHYLRAHKLYGRLEDPVDLAYVDWGLGQIHLRRGELGPARKRFSAARTGFRKGDETRGIVLCDTAEAAVLHALGRTVRAERLFDSAVRRARRAGIHAHLELFT